MTNIKEKDILLNDLYKNAHTALQSISDIMPQLDEFDNEIKTELKEEYENYEKYMSELSAYMKDNGIERKDINPMKKAMMWGAIKMNTMADKTDTHIADIMLKGTLNGITDLATMLNKEDTEVPEDVKKYAKALLEMQEANEEKLKKYL